MGEQDQEQLAIVRRAFAAFTRRDADALVGLSADDVEFVLVTAQRTRGGAPYRGAVGVRAYFTDVAGVWRELRAIPQEFRTREGVVLALGRVYARDFEGSLIDSPAGWLWQLRDGRVAYCRVFDRPEEAVEAFQAGGPVTPVGRVHG